jgi:hypothetical protein
MMFVEEAKKKLTLEETQKAQAIFGDPSPDTRDKLWVIAVYAFAIVMVGAFVGFFAGLFAPSPGSQQKG